MSGQRRWVPALLAAVLALMLPGGGEALPAGGAASVELPEEGGLVALTFDDGPRRRGEGGLSLIQQEPLMAVAGVAAQRKGGETVSGDAGTYFKRPDGMLYVLLCDGMGSGPEANRESTLAVRLLEQFLQAGSPPVRR